MTMKRFGFQAKPAEELGPQFQLQDGGREYQCRQTIDGLTLLETVAAMDESNPASSGGSLLNFFVHAVGDDDPESEAYLALRAEFKQIGAGVEQMIEVISYLLGEYTGLPTT